MIIGIGIDAVELERFRETMGKYGDRLLQRMFTSAEQEYCKRFPSPVEHFAVRFAAKESLLKAIGTGKTNHVKWVEMEILNETSGRPYMNVTGRVAEICGELGSRRIHVTLSHSQTVGVAAVVVED